MELEKIKFLLVNVWYLKIRSDGFIVNKYNYVIFSFLGRRPVKPVRPVRPTGENFIYFENKLLNSKFIP